MPQIQSRPIIEALDKTGLPYTREARTVGELPSEMVREALNACTEKLSTQIGLPAIQALKFGLPIHIAFGLTRAQAKNHPKAKLLLVPASDISLDYCNLFLPEASHA